MARIKLQMIGGYMHTWFLIRHVEKSLFHPYLGFAYFHFKDIFCRCKHWYEYSPHKAYCDSKLMIVAASNYLNFSLQEKKARVVVNSLHPGIADSNLTRHLHWLIKPMIAVIKKLFYLVC